MGNINCRKENRTLSSRDLPDRDVPPKNPDYPPDSPQAIASVHVEGQGAAMLEPGETASMVINHPTGPCGHCREGVPDLLPPGATMWVSWPNGAGYFTKEGWFPVP
jgi:hypothetical protein